MKRNRVATWVAIAGLALLSGCQTSRNGCGEGGGLLSRLGLRRGHGNGDAVLPGTVVGTPVSGIPCTSGVEGYAGPITEGPILEGAPPVITTTPPGGTLPHPMPLGTGAPPLTPVPNGALAPETPAPPSSPTSRRR